MAEFKVQHAEDGKITRLSYEGSRMVLIDMPGGFQLQVCRSVVCLKDTRTNFVPGSLPVPGQPGQYTVTGTHDGTVQSFRYDPEDPAAYHGYVFGPVVPA